LYRFFLFPIFLKKRHYNWEKKEKKKNLFREVIKLRSSEKEELKAMALNLGKLSQSSEFFLKRNETVTETDRGIVSRKNHQLYTFAYRLLELSGATKEELDGFLDDYEDGGKV
jgi:pullulanase/glycogen debranching enzyme